MQSQNDDPREAAQQRFREFVDAFGRERGLASGWKAELARALGISPGHLFSSGLTLVDGEVTISLVLRSDVESLAALTEVVRASSPRVLDISTLAGLNDDL